MSKQFQAGLHHIYESWVFEVTHMVCKESLGFNYIDKYRESFDNVLVN